MSLSPFSLWLSGWALMSLLMFVLWLKQCRDSDASVVDVGWAAGIGILVIFYSFFSTAPFSRIVLVVCLASVWSFRLAWYLWKDRVKGKKEDGRYQALRAYWGDKANFYHFFFFQAQGLLDSILSLSFLVLLMNQSPQLSIWELLGSLLWLVSISGEAIADQQLASFRAKKENKGKVCRRGLWKYSRHPNYFFEWLHWLSYVLMSICAPNGWVTLIPAALMYLFITRLTGIPYTEKQALKSRGEDYRRYQETTSILIPWFPKQEKS